MESLIIQQQIHFLNRLYYGTRNRLRKKKLINHIIHDSVKIPKSNETCRMISKTRKDYKNIRQVLELQFLKLWLYIMTKYCRQKFFYKDHSNVASHSQIIVASILNSTPSRIKRLGSWQRLQYHTGCPCFVTCRYNPRHPKWYPSCS